EFNTGDEWLTPVRVITEQDVIAFAALSGDLNPLHTDIEYCRGLGLPGLVPQTNLVIAVASGLIAGLGIFDRTGVALIGLTWRALGPILVGDTLRCRIRISDLEPVNEQVGLVVREVDVINQHDEIVHEGVLDVHVRLSPG
ncbi:MAG: MaoC/PaaZ C-terminal domain-containing protein, partial [Acidimicrobiia bacterium]